ncbi:MAG: hypothetical protein SFT92_02405 [Rickettsiales bacterium]|nr:hypothetical protein [Rickettsiales bacterium]
MADRKKHSHRHHRGKPHDDDRPVYTTGNYPGDPELIHSRPYQGHMAENAGGMMDSIGGFFGGIFQFLGDGIKGIIGWVGNLFKKKSPEKSVAAAPTPPPPPPASDPKALSSASLLAGLSGQQFASSHVDVTAGIQPGTVSAAGTTPSTIARG